MKKTEELIKEGIWAGLHDPALSEKEADVVVFGIPFDGSVSFRDGAREAPATIRSLTATIPPTTERFEDLSALRVKDIGDIEAENRDALFEKVEDKVCRLVEDGRFFTAIGGDHSVTIPILRGIDRALGEEFGILHLDAHFDLCDALDGDPLSHGGTARRAVELKNITSSKNIFFIGIRSPELDELAFIRQNPVNCISAVEYDEMGTAAVVEKVCAAMAGFKHIYLTLDIDCLDPAYAAGTGTPQIGGLSTRQLLNLLNGLFRLPIIGFDVVEVAPKLDPAWNSVFAAKRIITECWGHRLRKS